MARGDVNISMQKKRIKLLIVGVGGQGVLTISRVIGEAALSANQDVILGQLHGMSQRGGSVSSTVLIGPGKSSFIADGQADVVLGLEPLEVLRALPIMNNQTKVVTSIGRIVPFILTCQGKAYPAISSILEQVRAVTPYLYEIDGQTLLKELGDTRNLNVILLGALVGLEVLPFDETTLWKTVKKRVKPHLHESAKLAFAAGIETMKKSTSSIL